jgi:hypothetical protein
VADPDSWQTPHTRDALASVAKADAELAAAVSESQRAEREMRDRPDYQQRLRDVEDYARSRAAPRVLRDLQQRIDDGELSWHAIAAGKHLDDPDVRAVLAAGITEPIAGGDEDADTSRGYAFTHFDPDAAD